MMVFVVSNNIIQGRVVSLVIVGRILHRKLLLTEIEVRVIQLKILIFEPKGFSTLLVHLAISYFMKRGHEQGIIRDYLIRFFQDLVHWCSRVHE